MWWLADEGLRCQIFGAFTVLIAAGILGSLALYILIFVPNLLWLIPICAPLLLFSVGAILAIIEVHLYKRFNEEDIDHIDKLAKDWWQD